MIQSHRTRLRSSDRSARALALLAALAAALGARPAMADPTVGIVTEVAGQSFTSFDADSDTIIGTATSTGTFLIDCGIVASQSSTLGLITFFDSQLHVYDLATSPPTPFAGGSTIPISNFGNDLALSPDHRFVVVCDGEPSSPIAVVDVAAGVQVSAFSPGVDCNSVDVCDDGSVLVASFLTSTLRRLRLDAAGTLADTGEITFVSFPSNVACAPGSVTAVVVSGAPSAVQSFAIPGLSPIDTRALSVSYGQSVAMSPTGDRVFARSDNELDAPGAVDAFAYDPSTGLFGDTLFPAISVARGSPGIRGMDQIAVHPDGSKLYVPEHGVGTSVFDAATGAPLTTIVAATDFPSAICLSNEPIAPSPPPNDSIEHATAIPSLPYSDVLFTGTATTAPTDPRCHGNGHTVWYSFTATKTGKVIADTFGSDYDTTLSAYVRCHGALAKVACNDDDAGLPQSEIVFYAVAGETYFLMAGSPGAAPGGVLQLHLRKKHHAAHGW